MSVLSLGVFVLKGIWWSKNSQDEGQDGSKMDPTCTSLQPSAVCTPCFLVISGKWPEAEPPLWWQSLSIVRVCLTARPRGGSLETLAPERGLGHWYQSFGEHSTAYNGPRRFLRHRPSSPRSKTSGINVSSAYVLKSNIRVDAVASMGICTNQVTPL